MFINNDDFKRGFEDGRKDALSGKDRDFFKMPFSKKYLAGIILGGANKTLETYSDGYKNGYAEGLKEKHFKITINVKRNFNNNSFKKIQNTSKPKKVLHNDVKRLNINPNIQLCLKCARQEYDLNKSQCQCRGTLWPIQNVGGINGNYDIDLAIKLIKLGLKPWDSSTIYNISKGGSMANPIIIEQIETLEELINFLNGFNEQLNDACNKYNKFLEDLADQQLDAQIYERYKNDFLEPTIAKINNVMDTISSEDIPYLNRIIGHLQDIPI